MRRIEQLLLRVEPALAPILVAATKAGADVVGLAGGALGRLVLHGAPVGREVARPMLLGLAEHPPFQDDPRMSELIGFFRLREHQP